MSHKNVSKSLTCTVDAFEEHGAALIFKTSKNSSQKITIPKRYLPDKIQIGEVLCVKIFNEKEAEMDQKKIAQHLLDEILNGN
jgi:hypothetical protein